VGTLLTASAAAFLLALLSAVTGFGGGVLLLPVFTALFGLRVAVPVLTLTQLSSNAARVWLNRRELHWRLAGRFAAGAAPLAVTGALLLAHAPLAALKRLLGVFLLAVVAWRRIGARPSRPTERTFVAVGAASGLGSALLGSVGPPPYSSWPTASPAPRTWAPRPPPRSPCTCPRPSGTPPPA
jgi:uncharacterized membrane protein YfcA